MGRGRNAEAESEELPGYGTHYFHGEWKLLHAYSGYVASFPMERGFFTSMEYSLCEVVRCTTFLFAKSTYGNEEET